MNTKLRLHYVVFAIGAFAVFSFSTSSELAPRESISPLAFQKFPSRLTILPRSVIGSGSHLIGPMTMC